MSVQPIDVICPRCQAAGGVKCTEPDKKMAGQYPTHGHHFVEHFHIERIDKAMNLSR